MLFYVRASNDTTANKNPFPGYKYDATDATDAAAKFLAQFPQTPDGAKLVITPDSALEFRVVATVAQPTTPPVYP